jgi:hypothetical protein
MAKGRSQLKLAGAAMELGIEKRTSFVLWERKV